MDSWVGKISWRREWQPTPVLLPGESHGLYVTCQAPLSREFSRQEYWSGLPFPSPGDLPNPGIQPGSPTLQPDTLPSEPPGRSLYTKKNVKVLVTQSCLTLCNSMDYSPPGFCLWNYPGKNSGVGCHSLLPGFKGHFKSST